MWHRLLFCFSFSHITILMRLSVSLSVCLYLQTLIEAETNKTIILDRTWTVYAATFYKLCKCFIFWKMMSTVHEMWSIWPLTTFIDIRVHPDRYTLYLPPHRMTYSIFNCIYRHTPLTEWPSLLLTTFIKTVFHFERYFLPDRMTYPFLNTKVNKCSGKLKQKY